MPSKATKCRFVPLNVFRALSNVRTSRAARAVGEVLVYAMVGEGRHRLFWRVFSRPARKMYAPRPST
jgi:hypothetical protein